MDYAITKWNKCWLNRLKKSLSDLLGDVTKEQSGNTLKSYDDLGQDLRCWCGRCQKGWNLNVSAERY